MNCQIVGIREQHNSTISMLWETVSILQTLDKAKILLTAFHKIATLGAFAAIVVEKRQVIHSSLEKVVQEYVLGQLQIGMR